MNKNIMKGYS